MPRMETIYYCEICGKKYQQKKKAAECEKEHLIPISVDAPIFDVNDNKSKYPESVLIHFGEKISARYYRKP